MFRPRLMSQPDPCAPRLRSHRSVRNVSQVSSPHKEHENAEINFLAARTGPESVTFPEQEPLKTAEIKWRIFMSSPYQPCPQDPSGGYGQPPQDGGDPSQRGYLQGGPVGFGEAISEGFKNIFTFS